MNPAPILLTMGDPAGIGPEIIAKAYRDDPALMRPCVVVANVGVMRRANAIIESTGGIACPIAKLESLEGAFALPHCIPVLEVAALEVLPDFGRIDANAGRAAAQCIGWAARAALEGKARAIVTAPLHKEALSAAGVSFPGHTEMLQDEAARWAGRRVGDVPVRMMLANDELRTVLVSIHLSLRDALAAVTREGVLETIRITHASLAKLLGRSPRIAVAGLNPHAGEGGLFGREEIDIIAPAIASAAREGIDARGPYAPDTVFMRARTTSSRVGEFDVVVAMYHDQGLIPVKYLGVEKGVNVTLGLPFVRTSPDHGTAFDIAGTGRADASSLIEAVRQARLMTGDAPASLSAA